MPWTVIRTLDFYTCVVLQVTAGCSTLKLGNGGKWSIRIRRSQGYGTRRVWGRTLMWLSSEAAVTIFFWSTRATATMHSFFKRSLIHFQGFVRTTLLKQSVAASCSGPSCLCFQTGSRPQCAHGCPSTDPPRSNSDCPGLKGCSGAPRVFWPLETWMNTEILY